MKVHQIFGRFYFSVLPCRSAVAERVISEQSVDWAQPLNRIEVKSRSVVPLLMSPDGPTSLPDIEVAILLSEVDGPLGVRTVFASSVSDGYISMLHMISERIHGKIFAFEVSDSDAPFPKNSFTVIETGLTIRSVYSMKTESSWDFYQIGDPLCFEETDIYSRRRKSEKVNADLIGRYIKSIGYGSLNTNFWADGFKSVILASSNFQFPK